MENKNNTNTTPSLVGVSVRSINDRNNPDFQDEQEPHVPALTSSTSQALLHKIQHHVNHSFEGDPTYTSVAELNREGALLTDEVDMDTVVNVTSELTIDGEEDDNARQKRLLMLKKKKKNLLSTNNGSTGGSSLVSSPSPVGSNSLVTSTDPIDDQISLMSSSNEESSKQSPDDEDQDASIRNSYGEIIKNDCNRPHLARGDSYQSISKATDENEPVPTERHGRSFQRTASTEYLRSLSRSLSRDPTKKPSNDQNAESASDVRMYSTNNYSISQADLQNAPHIIQQPLLEEEEEDDDSSASMKPRSFKSNARHHRTR
ncbi:hypothetical protein Kpol_1069p16 [Vanderwaltozyma polyspora DSM 70294]|uniref:Uncharacterized protein n=1 Tax=Vanderwaltozyma polyspora (strain ATCC 22028 / DSM 70294 / BCRC 21397 / CBS 2163 / NBRC 10782 / NRRL Y-8283 / UCD 57-17) TaxID=436907 RepID=A7TRC5_VANPO|nr:uncharacterized protein Kpol_1069p16 [Vanderwaltozyma polyspora DSM 70294]EDO15193.1 hypothetical protein Kpol_1069p16 [Vanderwaltozyma polyspora DSM 70294]